MMDAISRAVALCDKGFATHTDRLYAEIDVLLSKVEQTESVMKARRLCDVGPTLTSPRFAYPHIKSALLDRA